MARSFFHLLFLQDHHTHSFFNLFTFSFPVLLICLLLTWAASSTSIPPTMPSSSAVSAANFLSPRGYSLFASAILSPSFNATGTILAPPDFALSFAAKSYLHTPPRASLSLLLYHTLNVPLSYQHLSSIADNSELRTLSGDNCLFLYKKTNGDISIAVNKKRTLAVNIRQPDLYVDDHLTVHGIDGVLDPRTASTCSLLDPTVRIKSHVDRMFLDHAIRALKRRGFTVVGTAMAIKRRELMDLNGVTVFAVSDVNLFSVSDGFHYDFSHHVVPKRMRLSDISRVPVGTVMETMATNKTIVIREVDGQITVNGIKINVTEVYHNRWIVVISVLQSLEDAVGSSVSLNDRVPSPAPSLVGGSEVYSPTSSELHPFGSGGVPSTSAAHSPDPVPSPKTSLTGESQVYSPSPSVSQNFGSAGVPSTVPVHSPDSVPSPAPIDSTEAENITGTYSARELSQSPSPIPSGEAENVVKASAPESSLPFSSADESASAPASPLPFSSTEEFAAAPANTLPFYKTGEPAATDDRCALGVTDAGDSAVFLAIEGVDLFCPVNVRRELEESKSLPSNLHSSEKDNQSEPLITLVLPSESRGEEEDKKDSKREDQMFMADDLFFYN